MTGNDFEEQVVNWLWDKGSNPTFVTHFCKSYNKNRYIFEEFNDTDLLFGFEAEMEIKRKIDKKTLSYIKNRLKNNKQLYVKYEDVGYGDSGIEINSHPFNIRWLESKDNKIGEIFKVINKSDGIVSHNGCGFHIHIDKKRLKELDKEHTSRNSKYGVINKMIYMIYKYPKFFHVISGRTNFSLGEFSDVYFDSISDYMEIFRDSKNIAFTEWRQTYEFRLFKGTKDYKVLTSYIKFLAFFIHYCCQNGIEDMSIISFMNQLLWLDRKTYNFIKKRLGKHIVKIKQEKNPWYSCRQGD